MGATAPRRRCGSRRDRPRAAERLLEIVHVYDEPATVNLGKIGAPQYHNAKPVEGDAERIVNARRGAREVRRPGRRDRALPDGGRQGPGAVRRRRRRRPAGGRVAGAGRSVGARARLRLVRRPPQGGVPRGRRARRAHRRRPRRRRHRRQRRGRWPRCAGRPSRPGAARRSCTSSTPGPWRAPWRSARWPSPRRPSSTTKAMQRRRRRGRGEGARAGRRGGAGGRDHRGVRARAWRSRCSKRRRRARRCSWSARTSGAISRPWWWGRPATALVRGASCPVVCVPT